jgi:hypothetical protein
MSAPALTVMFRTDRSGPFKGDVTAVFPTLPSDYAGRYFTVYAHLGQHGSGSAEWLRSTRPATDAEAADLLAELRGIYETGPDAVRLVQVKRRTAKHREEFRQNVRQSLAALRADPSGAPWSPDARAEAFAAAGVVS